MWADGKSLEVWHTGWQFNTGVTDEVGTAHAQVLHLQCFSKWDFYTPSFKDIKQERFRALLSITRSFRQQETFRLWSCSRMLGIFRHVIFSQALRSNFSKAWELERKHSNSLSKICTERRSRLFRFLKGPSSGVGWKAQQESWRYRIEFWTPSVKSVHGTLCFMSTL